MLIRLFTSPYFLIAIHMLFSKVFQDFELYHIVALPTLVPTLVQIYCQQFHFQFDSFCHFFLHPEFLDILCVSCQ